MGKKGKGGGEREHERLPQRGSSDENRKETEAEPTQKELWGILYADDGGIVSRFTCSLAKMMTIILRTCGAFGLTVSETTTETICMRRPKQVVKPMEITAAG